MKCISRKHRNNGGFSILELIVVIAIMATLTGMLVPRVVKYISDSRRNACIANRDAILSVYEKCVYNMTLDASQDSLETVLAASDSDVLPQEYMNQVKDYLVCPSDGQLGHYDVSFYKDGQKVKAYITCDEHSDEVCMVDLTGWAQIVEAEGEDATITNPDATGNGLPFDPDLTGAGDDDDEEPETFDEEDVYARLGVWPYSIDPDGKTDVRWKSVGTAVGKYVSISVPAYAHFKDRGQEFVIIKGNNPAGNGYKVMYEKSDSPGTCVGDGILYDITDSPKKDVYLNPNGSLDQTRDDNLPAAYEEVKVNTDDGTDLWRLEVNASMGDILTVHFADGSSATYIYTGESRRDIPLPASDEKAYGIAYDDWYVVPALFGN